MILGCSIADLCGVDDYDFRLWICHCFILTLCLFFLMLQVVMFVLICTRSMWNVAVFTVFITYFNIIVNKVRIHSISLGVQLILFPFIGVSKSLELFKNL